MSGDQSLAAACRTARLRGRGPPPQLHPRRGGAARDQTAISHQIRALEERLGVRLFRRLPRGLVLTAEAQRYLPAVRDAFARIDAATAELLAGRTGGTLTASALPSFAAKWLVPRLGRFRAAHPDIDLRISTSQHLVDFTREDVDVGIRMGRGHYPVCASTGCSASP